MAAFRKRPLHIRFKAQYFAQASTMQASIVNPINKQYFRSKINSREEEKYGKNANDIHSSGDRHQDY